MEEIGDPVPAGPVTSDRRVDRLLHSMDLAEKVGQLVAAPLPEEHADWTPGPPPGVLVVPAGPIAETRRRVARAQQQVLSRGRHAVPALVLATGAPTDATRYPSALALAAAWDPDLVAAVAQQQALAARAMGVHAILGPVVAVPPPGIPGERADLRMCFGADPHLVATLVTAYVRGAQGGPAGPMDERHVACVGQHLGGDGARLDGRASYWDERSMRSYLLAGGEAAVRAGVSGLMPSYSSNGGIPVHVDSWLLRKVVRSEWHFPGVVMSAPGALRALAGTPVAGGDGPPLALALESGVDVLLDGGAGEEPEDRRKRIVALVEAGALPEWLVDDAVTALLRVKARMGLFDAPSGAGPVPAPPRPEAEALLRRAVAAGTVLVSDPSGLVPLPVGPGPGPDDGPGPAPVEAITVVDIVAGEGAPPSRTAEALVTALRERFPGLPVDHGPHPRPGALVVALLLDTRPGDAVPAVGRIVGSGHRCVALHCGPSVGGLAELVTTTASVLLSWEVTPAHAVVIADVLAGAVEPAGRLPLSLGSVRAGPGHTLHPECNRNVALPLGHRSGWTGFDYSDLSIAPQRPLPGEPVVVECVVTNNGTRRGRAVVQVHLHDRVSSIVRSGRLVGFGSVTLNPGQRGRVRVELPHGRFSVWDRAMRHVVEPGTFDVVVGPTNAEGVLHGTVTLGDTEG